MWLAMTKCPKWIGNDDNLIHAHRMRALCDGIMVGSGTVRNDHPKLTVRHVEGNDPVKVLIGTFEIEDIHELKGTKILISKVDPGLNGQAQHIKLEPVNQWFHPNDILNALYAHGIHSIYIEGGALTSSLFLTNCSLDQIQIHISPKILGAGLTGFNFEGIHDIEHVVGFQQYRYIPIGSEMMFVGVPVYR